MTISREELLKLTMIKTSVFKVPSLNGAEIKLRELTIAEAKEFGRIATEIDMQQAILHACKCSFVEPSFFTDEELEQLGNVGNHVIMEVFNEIPLIGKNQEEREEHLKKINETLKTETEEKKEPKKPMPKKSENSSLN